LVAAPAAAAMMGSSTQDQAFVTAAAQGGMAEVQEAKIAKMNSSSSIVKMFATRMIADHTKANAKLMTIANKDGFTLPSRIGATNEAMKEKLQGLTGGAFDTAYLNGQVSGHEKTAAVMEKEISAGQNADLVTFAKTTLPTVELRCSCAASRVVRAARSPFVRPGDLGNGVERCDHPLDADCIERRIDHRAVRIALGSLRGASGFVRVAHGAVPQDPMVRPRWWAPMRGRRRPEEDDRRAPVGRSEVRDPGVTADDPPGRSHERREFVERGAAGEDRAGGEAGRLSDRVRASPRRSRRHRRSRRRARTPRP
jgi:predicted outer membrane protein